MLLHRLHLSSCLGLALDLQGLLHLRAKKLLLQHKAKQFQPRRSEAQNGHAVFGLSGARAEKIATASIHHSRTFALMTHLDEWLSKFILEARRQDGNKYPRNTLYNIACGIMRHVLIMHHMSTFLLKGSLMAFAKLSIVR
uniref:Uncharacterized protein n=1 Tax=Amphimedon queenslandica TaxID=400682 RepID=A0A1X7V2F4_AMPQE